MTVLSDPLTILQQSNGVSGTRRGTNASNLTVSRLSRYLNRTDLTGQAYKKLNCSTVENGVEKIIP